MRSAPRPAPRPPSRGWSGSWTVGPRSRCRAGRWGRWSRVRRSGQRSSKAVYTVVVPILMLCLLAVFSGMQAQPATPSASGWTLRLVAPDPLYLVGRTRVVAVALDPSGKPFEKISWMNLSLDGRELGADSRPPYEWEVDVGAALDRHRLELTAVARDGGRSTLSVLSPSYPFVDAVGVNLVLVPAVVRVGGRAVTGLTSSDFTLLEDGVAQTITSFSSEPMPASMLPL